MSDQTTREKGKPGQGSRRGIEFQIGWGMKPEMLFLVDWSQRNQTSTVQIDIQQQNTAAGCIVFCGLSWSWSMHAFWFSQFWRISCSLQSYPFFIMGKEREESYPLHFEQDEHRGLDSSKHVCTWHIPFHCPFCSFPLFLSPIFSFRSFLSSCLECKNFFHVPECHVKSNRFLLYKIAASESGNSEALKLNAEKIGHLIRSRHPD